VMLDQGMLLVGELRTNSHESRCSCGGLGGEFSSLFRLAGKQVVWGIRVRHIMVQSARLAGKQVFGDT
jgi:hypothetical protein